MVVDQDETESQRCGVQATARADEAIAAAQVVAAIRHPASNASTPISVERLIIAVTGMGQGAAKPGADENSSANSPPICTAAAMRGRNRATSTEPASAPFIRNESDTGVPYIDVVTGVPTQNRAIAAIARLTLVQTTVLARLCCPGW